MELTNEAKVKIRKLLKGAKDYNENKEFWEFLHDSYKGGKDYKEGDYLKKHAREDKDSFRSRKEAAAYTNFVSPIVDLYTSYIFSKDVKREIKVPSTYDNAITKINEGINLNGDSITEFSSNLARWTLVYGRMLAIVDAPQFEGDKSIQYIMDNGLLPYISMYQPTSVINWKLSAPGLGKRELELLVLFEGEQESDDREWKFYKIWTKEEWILIKVKGRNNAKVEIVAQGINKIGGIPAVQLTFKDGFENDLADGQSLISDISYMSKTVYDLDSNINEIVEHSAFPLLEIPYTEGDDTVKEIGTGNAITYDANNPQARSTYIEPSNSSMAAIHNWRNQLIEDIRQMAHMIGASVEKQAESGIALEARQQALHSTLGSMSKKLQKAEIMLYKIILKYFNIDGEVNITYPKTFAIKSLSNDIDNVIKAKTVVNSPTFTDKVENSIAIKTIASLDGEENITQEDKAKIESEIKSEGNSVTNLLAGVTSGSNNSAP